MDDNVSQALNRIMQAVRIAHHIHYECSDGSTAPDSAIAEVSCADLRTLIELHRALYKGPNTVSVPVEPSEAMRAAGSEAAFEGPWPDNIPKIYKAMVQAA